MKSFSSSQNAAVLSPSPTWGMSPWRGAVWKLLACLCFAFVNVMVRGLTGGAESPWIPKAGISGTQLAFLQNVVGACLLLPFMWRWRRDSLKSKRPFQHGWRVLFAVAGLICWYAALKNMPIAYAIALSFMGPVFGILASRMFLKEPLTPIRVVAVLCSFAGSFFLTRPDRALFEGTGMMYDLGWVVVLPLISALLWVGHKILSSSLAKGGESASLMTLYLLLFMAPVSAFPAFADWHALTFEAWQWAILVGLVATCAHLALAKSFALADVTFLTPFGFARLFLSGLLAYFLFAEMPHAEGLWIGVGLILFSLLILSRDKAGVTMKQ